MLQILKLSSAVLDPESANKCPYILLNIIMSEVAPEIEEKVDPKPENKMIRLKCDEDTRYEACF